MRLPWGVMTAILSYMIYSTLSNHGNLFISEQYNDLITFTAIALLILVWIWFFIFYHYIIYLIGKLQLSIITYDFNSNKGIDLKTKVGVISDFVDSFNAMIVRMKFKNECNCDYQNYIDEMTRLPNQLWINRKCDVQLFNCVILIQVDSINHISDSLKNEEYKQFVRDVTSVLINVVGDDGVLIRIEPNKYALFSNSNNLINYFVGKIRTINSVPFTIGDNTLYVDFWFGSAVLAIGEKTKANELLDDAKVALYEAKRSMTRHVKFDCSMRMINFEKIRTYNKLKSAILNDEFIPYFQPIVDLNTGLIIGAEALARWNDPERGIISPIEFIQVAEDNGLIDDIGFAILSKSLTWTQDNINNSNFKSDFKIHINISIRQLMNDDFVNRVRNVLASLNYEFDNVYFEVTESVCIDSRNVIDNIEDLSLLGIKFSIDDFGTGYSSFAYLRDIDFSNLKIDRSFVKVESRELVKAIITMASSLGYEVIAEGVENKGQYEMLKDFGCRFAQGYLFSEPLSADVFVCKMTEVEGKLLELL